MLPDMMRRLHAPTKASTLGIGAILIGSMIYFMGVRGELAIHEILITLFVFITAPVSGMMIAKAHMLRDRGVRTRPAADGNGQRMGDARPWQADGDAPAARLKRRQPARTCKRMAKPSAPHSASNGSTPILKRNSATQAMTRKRERGRIEARGNRRGNRQRACGKRLHSRNSTCSTNHNARFRITPTTAAVIAVSAPASALFSRVRSM